jgi:hypothetical protein
MLGLVAVAVAAVAVAGCGSAERHAAPPASAQTVAEPPPAASPATVPQPKPAARPKPKPAARPKPKPKPAARPQPKPVPTRPAAGRLRCLDHGAVEALGDDSLAYVAVARHPTEARYGPAGRSFASFDLTNENGHATVFGVRGAVRDGCGRLWYEVELPMRPNGVKGYVAARDVDVLKVRARIVVDLSERHLTYFRDGEPALEAKVAVGAPSTPTPMGRYYVNQRLIAADPGGPWGPAAIGISAFSDVLQEWSQGGPIAIHGTNEPDSIGRAVSHGCIRLPNATLRKLFTITPAGTPVIIHP